MSTALRPTLKPDLTTLLLTKLTANKVALTQQWNAPEGTPTRHFVIDNLLPIEICKEIYEAFPRDGNGFFSLDTFREKKRTSVNLEDYDPILSDITYAFQSPEVVDLIAEICGFEQIEPDPQLYAGGLSMMFNGHFLNPHLDNSHDGKRDRYRRLNLLYYVSPNWEVGNGGSFELWDAARTKAKVIAALTNRFVVMETNKYSWHSVSKVLVDHPRCCVSNYYFSKISPDATEYFHVTSFSGRPEEKVKKVIGVADNVIRNIASKTLKRGRGKFRSSPEQDGK